MSLRLVFASAALLAALALPASAQSPPSATGVWNFATAELNDSCTISGEMTLKSAPAKTAKAFSCSFKAVQSCKGGVIRTIHTQQSCIATQTGAQVVITSKLEKVESVDPPALMAGMDKRYAPDNFDVTINTAGDEMTGKFESMGRAPVKFQRKQELVS